MPYEFDTTPERSKLMKKIKGSETKPEVLLRKALWARGLRYRKNVSKLPGKPDIVIAKYNIAIFIDGEFWHGYNWQDKKQRIKSNREYWIQKIEGNMERDIRNTKALEDMGYYVYRFWENEVKRELNNCVDEILKRIGANDT